MRWFNPPESTRAMEVPRVFSPAILSTFTRVTFDASFFMFPGILSPKKRKLFGVASFGSLQNYRHCIQI